MAEVADLCNYNRVLEPSAGTGNIMAALLAENDTIDLQAVEINQQLCKSLQRLYPEIPIFCRDFLGYTSEFNHHYDRIVMNPPFANAQDIAHIKHAMTLLVDDGLLVAICANGPRQNEQLKPLADSWEVLPDGTFSESGTNVSTVLLTLRRKPE
jgi:tRNA1(Val) A37 N6-methylase TrmN6